MRPAARKSRRSFRCPKGTHTSWSDIVGMSVYGTPKARYLGMLKEVIQTGAVDVYAVANENGSSLMFPALKRVILETDMSENKKMTLDEKSTVGGLRSMRFNVPHAFPRRCFPGYLSESIVLVGPYQAEPHRSEPVQHTGLLRRTNTTSADDYPFGGGAGPGDDASAAVRAVFTKSSAGKNEGKRADAQCVHDAARARALNHGKIAEELSGYDSRKHTLRALRGHRPARGR